MAAEGQKEDTTTTEPAANQPEIELTDREMAIINGQDPDRVSETTTTETTEIPPGKEAVPPDGGREAAKETTSTDTGEKPWYSDEDRQMASSYGMEEADLKGYANADEFRKTTGMLDRQLATIAARRLQAQQQQTQHGQSQTATGQPATPATPAQTQPANHAAAPEDDFDPEVYVKENYDEHTVKMAKRLKAEMDRAKALDAKLGQVSKDVSEMREASQRQAQEQTRQAKLHAFHSAADKLDQSLFGRATDDQGRFVKLDEATDGNRRKLYDAADILVLGIEEAAKQAGVQPVFPPYEMLIRRAQQMVFAEQLQKQREEAQRKALADQSRRRRPVGATRPLGVAPPAAKATTQEDEAQRLANNPALTAIWNDMHEDSGRKAA